MPVTILAAVTFAIIFYVWTTYATTIGYGVAELATDPFSWVNSGIAVVAQMYLGTFMAKLVEIGAMFSAFIVCVACATANSRTLFAIGREGLLLTWLSKTHPTYKTPVNATVCVVVAATVVAVIVGFGFPTDDLRGAPPSVNALMATIGSLAVILVYIGMCIGGVTFFRQTSRKFNPLLHGVVPLLGANIFTAAWYGSVYPVPIAPSRPRRTSSSSGCYWASARWPGSARTAPRPSSGPALSSVSRAGRSSRHSTSSEPPAMTPPGRSTP